MIRNTYRENKKMDLPSHELQAFRTVAQTLNFSAAADRIGITQPALTQRIQSLEKTLQLTLLVRDRKGIKLTEAGFRLLRFCQIKEHLESELLAELVKAPDGKFAGRLRIAGYSSVLHSVIMPSLAPLLRDNTAVQFEFSMHEMASLPGVLERGEADFVIMDNTLEKASLQTLLLGHESYVLIESSKQRTRQNYLDHDPEDTLTQTYLKQKTDKSNVTRCFVDDIEGILQGVALGLGKGVVPRHLLRKDLAVRTVKNARTMSVPVVLHYFRQSYYSSLQKAVIETLKKNASGYLQ